MDSIRRKPVATSHAQSGDAPKVAEVDTAAVQPQHTVFAPENEHKQISNTNGPKPLRLRVHEMIENIFPSHRRYCGLSRRWACIVVLVVFLALLALILGLAIGLSLRNQSVTSLPSYLIYQSPMC